jgi:SET domain-containing protein
MSIGNHSLAVRRTTTGLGLFTLRPVRAGGRVVEYVGTVITSEEAGRSRSKYLFTLDERSAIDGKGRGNLARYVNHSCRPNSAGYTYGRRIWICALRAVAAGEQITIDYGADYLAAHFGREGCQCEPCAAAVPVRPAARRR